MPKSSKQWLRRHVTDAYVRKAKAQGYRSRAAFKLFEIDQKYSLFKRGMSVVDLGAAPGGWSQVAAQKGARVIAVDLLPMDPIDGVTVVRGDFREIDLAEKADVVLSDVSPNLSGIRSVDQARGLELAQAAIALCRASLQPDGAFVIKAFQGEAFDALAAELAAAFETVIVFKPAASRGESRETYFICRDLK